MPAPHVSETGFAHCPQSSPTPVQAAGSFRSMGDRLQGKRILVTSCDSFMGPPIVELFRSEGAEVMADEGDLRGPEEPAELVARCGELDVVVANLDIAAYGARVRDIEDEPWADGFDAMVHPLMRLVRAVAPSMIERGNGSIIVAGSSSPLRRMKPYSTGYVVARAAQNAFVRSAGHELAGHGVRLNGIAQNFVANETYYPPELMENPKFVSRLETELPAKRLGRPEETAELALFLASDTSSFIMGQIISQDGGWS